MNTNTDNYDKLVSMIKHIKFSMLTTVGSDGAIHSRPMGTLEVIPQKFDGTLWFFSKRNSLKNEDISNDQHVNLAYADPDKHRYVSVSGHAFISSDQTKMKELWDPTLKAWFPEGLEDQDLSLIGVNVESAEIWDSPPGKLVQVLRFVKSAVTGKSYHQGTKSEHMDLSH